MKRVLVCGAPVLAWVMVFAAVVHLGAERAGQGSRWTIPTGGAAEKSPLTINAAIQGGSVGTIINKQGAGKVQVTSAESTIAGVMIVNGGTVKLTGPTNSFSGGFQVKYARTAQVATLADVDDARRRGAPTSASSS